MSFSVGSNGQWGENYNWIPTQSQLNNQGSAAQGWKAAYGAIDTQEQLKRFANSATFEGSQYIIQGDIKAGLEDGRLAVGADDFFFMNDATQNFTYGNGPAEAGDGNKYIFGNDKANTITGSGYSDRIQAGNGNDTVNGGNGNDEIWGEGGNDTLNGGEGRDVLYGNAGNDTLNGGGGADLLLGDKGDDKLDGGAGDDYVFGGEGNDTMTGGAGADRFYLSALSGSGTKVKDFKAGEKDNIWIIDSRGSKSDYTFTADQNGGVVIKKGNTIMATVENASVADVQNATRVGASRFENYAQRSTQT